MSMGFPSQQEAISGQRTGKQLMFLFWLFASVWLGSPKRNYLPFLPATCIQDLTLVSVSVDGKDLDKAHYEVTEKELSIKGEALPAGKPYSLKVGFWGSSGFRVLGMRIVG